MFDPNKKGVFNGISRKEQRYLALATIIMLSIIIIIVKQCSDKNLVLKAYYTKQGKMIGYKEVGSDRNAYVEYSYTVNGVKYSRRARSTWRFSECYKNVCGCRNKRFWVIYSKEDHSKSLINLKIEIQNNPNPKFSETLKGFR